MDAALSASLVFVAVNTLLSFISLFLFLSSRLASAASFFSFAA
jgi:hypothetical protein